METFKEIMLNPLGHYEKLHNTYYLEATLPEALPPYIPFINASIESMHYQFVVCVLHIRPSQLVKILRPAKQFEEI